MHQNSDFTTKINEINVGLSGSSQRYVNECCESESDGKIDGFTTGYCKRRGGVTVAVCGILTTLQAIGIDNDIMGVSLQA
jgi:hypothetical protein